MNTIKIKADITKYNVVKGKITAFDGEKEVGFMTIGENKLGYYIIITEVLEDYRKQGIYQRMLELALYHFIVLNSFSRSEDANAIYEKRTGKSLETNQLVKVTEWGYKVTKKLIN